jgi:hypothetical protein
VTLEYQQIGSRALEDVDQVDRQVSAVESSREMMVEILEADTKDRVVDIKDRVVDIKDRVVDISEADSTTAIEDSTTVVDLDMDAKFSKHLTFFCAFKFKS